MNTRFVKWEKIDSFELTPIRRGHKDYGLFGGNCYQLKIQTKKKTVSTFSWIIPSEQIESLKKAVNGKSKVNVEEA